MVLFFHDENLSLLRTTSFDRPFRDRRNAKRFVAWQEILRQQRERPLAFKTCAVVGSSGMMLAGQPRGAQIDRYDAVFRVRSDRCPGPSADPSADLSLSFS